MRSSEEQSKKIAQAHSQVSQAVRAGRLKRGRCKVCRTSYGIHGHHEDYEKPLEVVWLCRKHHEELHAKKSRTPGTEYFDDGGRWTQYKQMTVYLTPTQMNALHKWSKKEGLSASSIVRMALNATLLNIK